MDTPAFAYEQGLFLPERTALLYLNVDPLRAAFDAFVETNSDLMIQQEADALRGLLRVVDTASVTLSQDGEFSRARFILTLGAGQN